MEAGRRSGLGLRDLVIAAGFGTGIVFVLVELIGADIDKQAGQTVYTALMVVLFSIFGSAGAALTRLQPRFALFGVVTMILSLLAFGATDVLLWSSHSVLFGFGLVKTSGTVGGITAILAITTSATCVLLATTRANEDDGTRRVRVVGIAALTLFVTLAILSIIDHSVDIGARVYALIATVYVLATVVSVLLRLLPIDDEPISAAAPWAS